MTQLGGSNASFNFGTCWIYLVFLLLATLTRRKISTQQPIKKHKKREEKIEKKEEEKERKKGAGGKRTVGEVVVQRNGTVRAKGKREA